MRNATFAKEKLLLKRSARKFIFCFLATCFCFLTRQTTVEAQLKVENTINSHYDLGGEIQSTVIPPGLKAPKGRLLISRDWMRPPRFSDNPPQKPGLVIGFDLDNLSAKPIEATFDTIPQVKDYFFGTNDHDLVTLPNGDVLYITGAFSKRPLSPKPGWFDNTFRKNENGFSFGPGARTVVLTWRSEDGGKSFKFLSEFDPATVENGVPAYPQFGKSKTTAPWDMGGSDGTLVKVVPGTDQLYLTFGVVGFHPRENSDSFIPDTSKPVAKTLLLSSKGGTSWKSLGFIESWNAWAWRMDIVPLEGDHVKSPLLVSGMGNNGQVALGKKTNPMHYEFGTPVSFDGDFRYTRRVSGPLIKYIYTNISATTVMGRVPGNVNQVLVVYPSVLDKKENGCRMYFYNPDTDQYNEGNPIVPEDATSTGFVMHPTLIEPQNGGPLLLYWYDLNSKTMRGKIKGRIVTGPGKYTDDFDISFLRGNNLPFGMTSFDLKGTDSLWYGDYHTAGGFVQQPRIQSRTAPVKTANYFPVWIQANGKIHFAKVSYTYAEEKPVLKIPFKEITLAVKEIPPHRWTKSLRPRQLQKRDTNFRVEDKDKMNKIEVLNKKRN